MPEHRKTGASPLLLGHGMGNTNAHNQFRVDDNRNKPRAAFESFVYGSCDTLRMLTGLSGRRDSEALPFTSLQLDFSTRKNEMR
jgi:hypothetical protein